MFSICFCSTANSYRFRSCGAVVVPVGARGRAAVVGSHGEIVHGAFVNFAAQCLELRHVDGVGVFTAGGEVGDLAGFYDCIARFIYLIPANTDSCHIGSPRSFQRGLGGKSLNKISMRIFPSVKCRFGRRLVRSVRCVIVCCR